jgi:hypothetical protein
MSGSGDDTTGIVTGIVTGIITGIVTGVTRSPDHANAMRLGRLHRDL